MSAVILSSLLLAHVTLGRTNYVWLDSPSPAFPFTNWDTAARTIQDAVDAAAPGNTVLVKEGVYAVGARTEHDEVSNRVAIAKAIQVTSVSGPKATLIVGHPAPGGTNGVGVRCAYLGANAVLSGFTLTNGHTGLTMLHNFRGGGAWCEPSAVLTNCIITGNSSSGDGAGVHQGTLIRCTVANNRGAGSSSDGGGADHSTLYLCTIIGNYGRKGGGADNCTLFTCILLDNNGRVRGGGATRSTLYNCTVLDNRARFGGGVSECTVYNSIVFHNRALFGDNYSAERFGPVWFWAYPSSFFNSCTYPLPESGVGNIDLDPRLASWSHLSAASPCIGAGSSVYAQRLDTDEQPWSDPPSMGADQLLPGGAVGPLDVQVHTSFSNIRIGFPTTLRLQIGGQATANQWDFGDGTILTNRLEVTHAWNTPGTFAVRLTAFNDSHPAGITTTSLVQVVEPPPTCYVNPLNSTPRFPYTNWDSAALTIQAAIAAGSTAGRVVLVTNGVYATGHVGVWGLMTNRIALTNGVIVRSLNGPAVTFLHGAPPALDEGDGAIRGAYVGDGCVLDGFTVTNGFTRRSGHNSREQGGGGLWCESQGTVTNCIILGNQAHRDGGGANGGVFYNCSFFGNYASDGGAADDAILYDCLLEGNGADAISESILERCTIRGQRDWAWRTTTSWTRLQNCILASNIVGTFGSILNNCTLVDSGSSEGGFDFDSKMSTFNNCILFRSTADSTSCSLNFSWQGSETNIFADLNSGAFWLHPDSPCINAGANGYVTAASDFAGNPRIVAGTVDIGAYEAPSPASRLSYTWLKEFGFPTDGSVDAADPDGDAHQNWQEWIADTNPTNAQSHLRIQLINRGSPVTIRFLSSSRRLYTLFSAPSLAGGNWSTLQADVPGTDDFITFTDSNSSGTRFYRIGVKIP